jgi:hypothetical protein
LGITFLPGKFAGFTLEKQQRVRLMFRIDRRLNSVSFS